MLNDRIGEISNAINSAVDCSVIKRESQKVYASQAFPLALANQARVFVNVTPSGIGLSNVVIEPDKMRISGLVTAKAEVSDKGLVPTQMPLPPRQSIPPGAPRMNIALPFRASYEALQVALNRAVAGKTFVGDTPVGQAKVTVKEVEVYPSGDRVVLGLKVSAELPTSWLNTSGDVYLIAKPVVDGPASIHLADIGFARKLDNDFWNVATVVFEKKIIATLTEASHYDLSRDIDNAKAALDLAVRDPGAHPGMNVALTDVSMGLGRIAMSERELTVEGLLSARATITAAPR